MRRCTQLCDTYPQALFVPTCASTVILVGSASFRSKGRLPVLTYLHKNQAALCRCSQPLSGFSARCVEDEQLMNCIVQTNPNSKFMYVVDTRPRVSGRREREQIDNRLYLPATILLLFFVVGLS